MPIADPTRSRVWLQADVPRDVGEEFTRRAQERHRTARGQLRVLVEEFLNEAQDTEAGDFTGRAAVV